VEVITEDVKAKDEDNPVEDRFAEGTDSNNDNKDENAKTEVVVKSITEDVNVTEDNPTEKAHVKKKSKWGWGWGNKNDKKDEDAKAEVLVEVITEDVKAKDEDNPVEDRFAEGTDSNNDNKDENAKTEVVVKSITEDVNVTEDNPTEKAHVKKKSKWGWDWGNKDNKKDEDDKTGVIVEAITEDVNAKEEDNLVEEVSAKDSDSNDNDNHATEDLKAKVVEIFLTKVSDRDDSNEEDLKAKVVAEAIIEEGNTTEEDNLKKRTNQSSAKENSQQLEIKYKAGDSVLLNKPGILPKVRKIPYLVEKVHDDGTVTVATSMVVTSLVNIHQLEFYADSPIIDIDSEDDGEYDEILNAEVAVEAIVEDASITKEDNLEKRINQSSAREKSQHSEIKCKVGSYVLLNRPGIPKLTLPINGPLYVVKKIHGNGTVTISKSTVVTDRVNICLLQPHY